MINKINFQTLVNVLGMLLAVVSLNAFSTEIAVWDKTPIQVRLEVGTERLIHLPSNVDLGIPENIRPLIRDYNAAGTLYLTPKKPFQKTRFHLVTESGERIFLDVFATEGTGEPLEDLKVIRKADMEKTSKVYGLEPQERKGLTVKEILQYAHIDLFGVPRLKPKINVAESYIKKPLRLDLLFGGRSAGLFELNAFKQYRTQSYTVTAILLTNKSSKPREIKYTDLYPSMIAASVHHLVVGPAGTVYDETVLLVVTKKPLSEYAVYSPSLIEKSNVNEY
ncbi:DUF3438 family protein [Vibrio parahaemolyticus]